VGFRIQGEAIRRRGDNGDKEMWRRGEKETRSRAPKANLILKSVLICEICGEKFKQFTERNAKMPAQQIF